jgi:hypothetical protein
LQCYSKSRSNVVHIISNSVKSQFFNLVALFIANKEGTRDSKI